MLMSLSTLSSTMSVRDHMITNRLPSSIKVPVVPQRHQFVDYDVLYGILIAPDVVSVSSLDVVALKVIISHLILYSGLISRGNFRGLDSNNFLQLYF